MSELRIEWHDDHVAVVQENPVLGRTLALVRVDTRGEPSMASLEVFGDDAASLWGSMMLVELGDRVREALAASDTVKAALRPRREDMQ